MLKKFALIFFLFLFLSVGKVYAVTTTISNVPSSVGSDPFTITVNISGAQTATNYLKVDLYKDGSTNYFGETFNGSSFYKDSDYKQYLPINIQSGVQFSGQVTLRMGSPSTTEYDSFGQYRLRVRRYTSSGNYNSTEANDGSVVITIATPTLTPTPIPTATLTPVPTAQPTTTPTPTQIPLITPSPTPTLTLTLTPTPTPTIEPISYNNIYLSEAFVYPESGGSEWIEIFNNNDFEVKLENWYIDDIEDAGSSAKKISLNIAAQGFAVYDLTSSMFNNDADSVRLLDFNKIMKDSFEYTSTTKNKSLGRVSYETDEFCLQEPTKNSSNGSCINPPAKSGPTPTPQPTKVELALVQAPNIDNLPAAAEFQSTLPVFVNDFSPGPADEPQVLGTSTQNNEQVIEDDQILYVKSFAASSMGISMLNILYIIHKIIRKIRYEKN